MTMAARVIVLVAAFAVLACADPSPACGGWSSGCAEDPMTHVFVNRTLTMDATTFPIDPAADYEGTFGSYVSYNTIYGNSSCTDAAVIATVSLFGNWIDNGPSNWASYRKIGVSYESIKIKPRTSGAVTTLQQQCPCGDPNAWQVGVLRTITICADACEIPWVNFSNVGAPHYGSIVVSNDGQTMNMTEFTPVASYAENATLFTLARDGACRDLAPFTELCGEYTQSCRPSANLPLNMQVSFSMLGSSVGTFTQAYDYYALNDTNCSRPFVASYHISGTYALTGPANCSGQCKNGVGIEVFASSSSFMPITEHSLKELNDNCPCNGTWKLGIARTITVCPAGTCSMLDQLEFTHGIPAGTIYSGYGILVPFDNFFISYTKFTRVDDYQNKFTSDDFGLFGDYTDECASGKSNSELTCGRYVSKCSGSPDRFANFVESVTFFGPSITGNYRRVFQQFEPTDRFCVEQPMLEYIIEGTYALDGSAVCPNCPATGVFSKVEISVTRTQITPYSQNAIDALRTNCPCGRHAWKLGTASTITTCPAGECLLETFPGIQGLSIGTVQPAYGTFTRFDQFITMSNLDSDPATGYHLPFTTSSHILYVDPTYDGCNVPPQNSLVCGTYTDGCRGGTVLSDSDNLIRSLTLTGEQFGQFIISQSYFLGFDVDCTNNTLNGQFSIYGTYALHGPSTCGGSCKGVGAQQIEMSTNYAVGQFYYGKIIDFLNTACPCGDLWTIGEARTIMQCPPGTCTLTIRGLPLGSGAPAYGSMLRFGDYAMVTTLSSSAPAGYSHPFDSLNQPMLFDKSSTGAACPSSPSSSLCGVYTSPCGAYKDSTTSFNYLESYTFSGTSSGTFTKTFKSYSGACSGIVLQQWELTGVYTLTGASTCGGTCTNANTTQFSVQQATITLQVPADVDRFNANCPCGGDWVRGEPRTLGKNCGNCGIYNELGAHGLIVGTPFSSFGSLTLASGNLALTRFSPVPTVGYATPFEPQTDRVLVFDATRSASLSCSAPSPSSSSSSGLSAGDGLLIAFFCILGVYLLGGMAYNYRAGATGSELLPHLSFWKSLPSLVADGFRFSFVDCFGLRGRPSEYQPITSSVNYGATA